MSASLRRIWGLIYRHLALYRRSWPRLLELAYWPTLQMLIWGFTASFVASRAGSGGAGLAAGAALLGGVLLWEVALRSQMGVALSFLEEVWSRNLAHVFVSPIRPWEMLTSLVGVSNAAHADRGVAGGGARLGAVCVQPVRHGPGAGAVFRQSDDHGVVGVARASCR